MTCACLTSGTAAWGSVIFRDTFGSLPVVRNEVFGTDIPVPGIASDMLSGWIVDLRASNRTLYLHVWYIDEDASSDGILQLEPPGPSPRWRSWLNGDYNLLSTIQPMSRSAEQAGEFRVFYRDFETFGSVAMNTGTPAVMAYPLPLDADGDTPDRMAQDYSSLAGTWAAFWNSDDTTDIRVRTHTDGFETVAQLPGWVDIIEPHASAPAVWVAIEQTLYEVDVNGGVETYDVSQLGASGPIRKIRSSQAGVYFSAGQQIFSVQPGGELSAPITIQMAGGDFAVTDSRLITGDGSVYRIPGGELLGTLIPPFPAAGADAADVDTYWRHWAALGAGKLEVRNDPFETRVFAWTPASLVSIPIQVYPPPQ